MDYLEAAVDRFPEQLGGIKSKIYIEIAESLLTDAATYTDYYTEKELPDYININNVFFETFKGKQEMIILKKVEQITKSKASIDCIGCYISSSTVLHICI